MANNGDKASQHSQKAQDYAGGTMRQVILGDSIQTPPATTDGRTRNDKHQTICKGRNKPHRRHRLTFENSRLKYCTKGTSSVSREGEQRRRHAVGVNDELAGS